MATRRVEIGPFGETVRRNVTRFRGLRGLTMTQLSARLTELGRPMGVSTLSGVENGGRRVDADDLVMLAAALDVSPASLLMPSATDPIEESVPADAVHGGRSVSAGEWWNWLTAVAPLHGTYPDEVDTFEVERWRRSQVPPFAWNRGR